MRRRLGSQRSAHRRAVRVVGAVLAAAWLAAVAGCAVTRPEAPPARPQAAPAVPVIIGPDGGPVTWDDMLADLAAARVVYVGERHTSAAHHAAQLEILRALHARHPDLVIGMEMFDRSYQAVLDRWSAGELDEPGFLRRTHWYANWRFDYSLYRPILEYARAQRLPVAALNLPFNIPPKIRVGGTGYLSDYEKGFLPARVDTSNEAHRAYVRQIFQQHDFRSDFEDFYLAQCVWEDVMAESVAARLGSGHMLVLAGNGHIQFKYGIPDRVFARTGLPFRTVILSSPGERQPSGIADYVWTIE